MRVVFRADPDCEDVVVTVTAPDRTPQVEGLLRLLRGRQPVTGWQGELARPLDPREVLRFYGENKDVLAQTAQGVYTVRLRLYELEALLAHLRFVRISNSEIVNLDKVTALDLSLSGTIRMTLEGGTAVYASRRCVKKLKEALSL